jgi:N-acetylglucosaminyldiphosphoundecaprenol N-acetyl-beta-D-mannosaminyltransferase
MIDNNVAAGNVRIARSDSHMRSEDLNSDALMREVYCLLGMPVDAIEMPALLRRIEAAASAGTPLFISTPNLNFLIKCRSNAIFRESLLHSDLCPSDGMPVVWISRIVGIPVKSKVSGSDFFEELKSERSFAKPLKVFLFGGAEGIAERACRAISTTSRRLQCVGAIYPGFGSVEELSQDSFIEAINSSGADFLLASLGAGKGQQWLLKNHQRLRIPIRAHLGAVLNFQAGSVRRAPPKMSRLGLEWLWRIKEEPHLWSRYWKDGRALIRLLLIYVLPLAIWVRWQRLRYNDKGRTLLVQQVESNDCVVLSLYGAATASHVAEVAPFFREAVIMKKDVIIDFAATRAIDARFLGLLFMLRKLLKEHGTSLTFVGVSASLRRAFRLHGADFLLSPGAGSPGTISTIIIPAASHKH